MIEYNGHQLDILVVEDSEDDLDLTLAALREAKVEAKIEVARDGMEALEFLFCTGRYTARNAEILPRLILLDIKLPKLDGLEVLQRIKTDPRTQHIPVVMLTSSGRKADLDGSYRAGANSYLVKSLDYEQFTRDVKQLGEYWLGLNRR